MGKDNSTESKFDNLDGGDPIEEKIDSPSIKKVGEKHKADVAPSMNNITLIFRQRRSFELYIGRNVYFFGPNEAKQVPADILEHPDFIPVRKYFTIKGV